MMPSNQLKNTVIRDLDTLIREIHTLYESKFKNYDLRKGQFIFLTRVSEHPGISLGELAYELKMDKTTITKAIQKLIDSGYINKKQDINDKRIWHLYTTDKCKNLYDQIIAEKNRVFSICFNGISTDEINSFCKIVNTISNNITLEWHRSIKHSIKSGEQE
jgi:DNA-binding MarR family transcriptional regulator